MNRRASDASTLCFAVVAILGFTAAAWAEPPGREPVDALWEQHMLVGNAVAVEIKDSQIVAVERSSTDSFTSAYGRPEWAVFTRRGISVMWLGEGMWRNGGWVMRGGLLGLASEGASTFELYGKAVERQHPYFPFPFHRDPPRDTGYEFFLLQRKLDSPLASIVRRWMFDPSQVDAKRSRPTTAVQATLRYDPGTRTATVTITGLRRPVEEQVNLATVLPKVSQ